MSKNIKHISRCYHNGDRYCVLRGGTRSGKTFAALHFLLFGALTKAFDVASVVAVSVPHLRRGALRDFQRILDMHGLTDDFRYYKQEGVYMHRNGSVIDFFSADNSDKLRGAQRDWLFVNEVNLLDEEDFNQLNVRTRRFVVVDFNPSAHFWLYDLLERFKIPINRIECVSTYKDNNFLTPEQRSAIEQYRSIKEWWRVYGEGRWGEAQGRAWYNWQIYASQLTASQYDCIGVDFGEGRSPTAVVGVNRFNNEYVANEIYYGEIDVISLAELLHRHPAGLIVGDSAQIDTINLLRKHGVNIYPARKMQLSASYHLLNSHRIYITGTSVNLLKEAKSIEWSDKSRAILRAGCADHAVDAVRYALHMLVL